MRAAVVAVLVVATGCSGGGTVGPTPVAGYTIAPTPADGTSGLRALEVDLGFFGAVPPMDLVSSIGAGATLATWPDLAPVQTNVAPTTAPQFMGRGFALVAASAAAAGWYAARLETPPPTVRLQPGAFFTLPDGRPAVRVHVGSAPALLSLSVCPKGQGMTALLITFNETVHPATTSAMPLAVAAGPAGAPAPCSTDQPPLVDRPQGSYEYVCGASLAPKDVVHLTLGAGMVSDDGVDVPALDRVDAVETFMPDVVISGCSSLRFGP